MRALNIPPGITVYGSATIPVAPDFATLIFVVSNIQPSPVEAFANNRTMTQKVRTFLDEALIEDAGVSLVNLEETYTHVDGEQQFAGYRAATTFQVKLNDLNRLEEILVGLVSAGVSRINNTLFQTSNLEALRIEARQQAMRVARDKAEVYCAAAGVRLGVVTHIEDLNSDTHMVRGAGGAYYDDGDVSRAFNPSSIPISSTVNVAYTIEQM